MAEDKSVSEDYDKNVNIIRVIEECDGNYQCLEVSGMNGGSMREIR